MYFSLFHNFHLHISHIKPITKPIIKQRNEKETKNGDNCNLFNIDYIDQYDRTGVHRHGWKYVIDNLSNNLTSLLCNQFHTIRAYYVI
jgi:hypothetical protein